HLIVLTTALLLCFHIVGLLLLFFPRLHSVKYGGDLKVDCVATGLPNPEISWGLPDGSMINTFMQSDDSGSRTKRYVVFNNGTLYFNDVGLREEGDYTCYAENQIGKDEMKVRVKVVAEPATIRNKTYVIINVPYGDVVTVACEAKGEPTPKVTWLSPTNRPIPTLSEKYQVYRDGTLLIQKAQRSDSGNYTCVVRNSAGEDRKVVWIHVNVQPPRINGHLNAITSVRETAIRDSRKLIDCKAEGIPAPRVLWAFPEGVILPAPYYGNRITVHRNGTLDIRGVRQTDAVQLVCIGRNEGGEARLIVQLVITDHLEKPSFRDPVNERITAIAGHRMHVQKTKPLPFCFFPFIFSGALMTANTRLQRFEVLKNGTFLIRNAQLQDRGQYLCTAQNLHGIDKMIFVLTVVAHQPKILLSRYQDVTVYFGDTIAMECQASGTPSPHISWIFPDRKILQTVTTTESRIMLHENRTLSIKQATFSDRGVYKCVASNAAGADSISVRLHILAIISKNFCVFGV
uniref:Matrix remodeling associated 5 n=1 Tax=Pavo cristatus TaxID=9049 RepID=A0A8C9LB38_PAVCR